MAFVKKVWKDRISDFPNRRVIDDGVTTRVVTVSRSEGTITEAKEKGKRGLLADRCICISGYKQGSTVTYTF